MVSMPAVSRFNAWVGFMVFSVVTLTSLLRSTSSVSRDGKEIYAVAVCCISLILSFLVVAAHFSDVAASIVVNSKIEAGVASILLALWCVAISVLQSSKNELAVSTVNGVEEIKNANLYFFSWACFVAAVYVTGSVAQTLLALNIREVATNAPGNLVKWYLLLAVSVVVIAASSELKSSGYCSQDSGLYNARTCRTTKFSISLGVLCSVISLAMIILTQKSGGGDAKIETVFSVVVFVFYCFGVAYITGPDGPGSSIGNLYFATWTGFIASLMLAAASLGTLMGSKVAASRSTEASDGGNPDREDVDI